MKPPEDAWIPLVDGPIGAVVDRVQDEHPEIAEQIDSPNRLLAFRTFAYIRVGILLGQLLVERDVEAENWVEELLEDRQVYDQVVREVLAVAKETADEPDHAAGTAIGPSDEERARFVEFAKRRLSTDA